MSGLADLLFPQPCLGCHVLTRGSLCDDCVDAIPPIGPEKCEFCGLPTVTKVPECRECRGRGFAFDRARQAFVFEGLIKQALHRFKYLSERSLGKPLAALIARLVTAGKEAVVTAAPGSAERCRRRGFDPVDNLARTVSQQTGLEYRSLLTRKIRRPPQVSLPPEERRRSLKGTFVSEPVAGLRFVLIDDVLTTGATASEAARALKAAGAAEVFVVCLARTLPARH